MARAVLALLCAVAVVYGTAMFPAAFDVELRSEQPDVTSGPSTPADPAGQSPGSTVTSTTTGTDTPADATETERSTPSRSSAETSTPPAAQSGSSGGGDGGNDGTLARIVGLLLLACAGLVILLSLGVFANDGGKAWSWLSAIPLPRFVSRLPLPSLSLRRIPQVTTLLIISAGGGLARLADDVTTIAGAVASTLTDGVGPVIVILWRSLVALPRATAALLAAPVRALGTTAALFGGLGFLRSGVSRPSYGGSETPVTDARSGSGPAPSTVEDESEPVASVLDAWAAMTDLVPVRNRESTTAAEYARKAVDAGLPAAPVERLTALFREVRYGGRADSGDRVSAARRALNALTGGED